MTRIVSRKEEENVRVDLSPAGLLSGTWVVISMDIEKTNLYNVYTDNYLPPFCKDLFRIFANCFLLLGCVNIPNTIS